jgi:tRNA wybutosine-synthesizing protein 1
MSSGIVNSLISGLSSVLNLGQDQPSQDNQCCSHDHNGSCCKESGDSQGCACNSASSVEIDSIKIFYSTLTGTAKLFANQLEDALVKNSNINVGNVKVLDIVDYDNEDFLAETAVCVFILSSYNVEGPLDW